jgi:CspA family cold shock protein
MPKPICRGTVKFWKTETGWGGSESDETPGDVWAPFSAIEGGGFQELVAGEPVEFRYVPAVEDSGPFRATWVRRLGPAGTGP